MGGEGEEISLYSFLTSKLEGRWIINATYLPFPPREKDLLFIVQKADGRQCPSEREWRRQNILRHRGSNHEPSRPERVGRCTKCDWTRGGGRVNFCSKLCSLMILVHLLNKRHLFHVQKKLYTKQIVPSAKMYQTSACKCCCNLLWTKTLIPDHVLDRTTSKFWKCLLESFRPVFVNVSCQVPPASHR